MAISMLKIRRPLGRLIFNMGIAIPGKTLFLIETAPRHQAIFKTTFDQDPWICNESVKSDGYNQLYFRVMFFLNLSPLEQNVIDLAD